MEKEVEDYITDLLTKGFSGFVWNRNEYYQTPKDEFVFYRACGDLICEECKEEYYRHPFSEHLDFDNKPWLRKLCNGDLIKL